MATEAHEDLECLAGRYKYSTVLESHAQGGAPVAAVVVERVGAVLRIEPGGADDDGWPQVTINVYKLKDCVWVSHGGGGFDWDWPLDFVPAEDEPSANRFGTPLAAGRGVWLVPHYGPQGAWLETVLDERYPHVG